jgi:hypothetical protein
MNLRFTSTLAAGRELPAPPPDSPNPFAHADPDRVRSILTTAGFVDLDLEPAHERMWFGHDADDACEFVLGLLGWMLEGPRRCRQDVCDRRTVSHH